MFAQGEIVTAVARVGAFVSGGLISVLLVFMAVDESVILHVKVANQNLLWWIGVLGIVFGASKSLQPDEKLHSVIHTINLVEEAETALMKVASFTHHYPSKWRRKAFRSEVKSDFERFFVFKVSAFAQELVSVVCAPLVLMVSLPPCAGEICEFVRRNRVEVKGVGDIIGAATFNLER